MRLLPEGRDVGKTDAHYALQVGLPAMFARRTVEEDTLRKLTSLLAVALAAAALPALATPPSPAAWPRSHTQHRAFFCGGELGGDHAPPAGFTQAEHRAITALTKKGMNNAEAVHTLRARARCNEIPLAVVPELELAPVGTRATGR
jgi:hypothetical protein